MKHTDFFYTPPEFISDDIVEIKGEELKHLSRVLRKKVRDIINVVDGQSNLYTTVITEIKKDVARGLVQKKTRFVGESNFDLTLAQAVPKSSRFEFVIEKGTELGVSAFLPLNCNLSVVESTPARIARWKKLAISAMKQSGRSRLPEILNTKSVCEIVENLPLKSVGLIAHPGDKSRPLSQICEDLHRLPNLPKSATILVGPESGFTPEEIEAAMENGFKPFSLGPRRLRSETAGIVSAAIFMELYGNEI